jgi:hypothetical protein
LQGDFRRLGRIQKQGHQVGTLLPKGAVFGQKPSSLPHQPDGRGRQDMAIQNRQQSFHQFFIFVG